MRYYMAPKYRRSSYLYRCNSLQLRVLHRRKRGFTEGNFSLGDMGEIIRHLDALVINSLVRRLSGVDANSLAPDFLLKEALEL